MMILRGFAIGLTIGGWLMAACYLAGMMAIGGAALGSLLVGNALMAAFTLMSP